MPRHALFRVTPQALLSLAEGRYEVLHHPIPQDVTLVSICATPQEICLVLEHASFAEVPEGDVLPTLDPPFIRKVQEPETP